MDITQFDDKSDTFNKCHSVFNACTYQNDALHLKEHEGFSLQYVYKINQTFNLNMHMSVSINRFPSEISRIFT